MVREAEKLWKKQKMGKEDAWLRTNEDRPDGGVGGRIVRDPDGQTQLREETERQRDQDRWREAKDTKEADDRRQENKDRQEEEWSRQDRVDEELRRKGLDTERTRIEDEHRVRIVRERLEVERKEKEEKERRNNTDRERGGREDRDDRDRGGRDGREADGSRGRGGGADDDLRGMVVKLVGSMVELQNTQEQTGLDGDYKWLQTTVVKRLIAYLSVLVRMCDGTVLHARTLHTSWLMHALFLGFDFFLCLRRICE